MCDINNEIRQAIYGMVYPDSRVDGMYNASNNRRAVRWDADYAQWQSTMESIHEMDAWFYVRVGELGEKESPKDSVGADFINVRFVVPSKMVMDNWRKPKWHSDKVRIYLRSYLHKKGYDFYAPYNLGVKRNDK